MKKSDIAVLLIDDDAFFSQSRIEKLGDSFLSVDYYQDPSEAAHVLGCLDRQSLVIIDAMMPPPSRDLLVSTENGQTTGIWLVSEYYEKIVRTKSALIILSNVDVRVLENQLAEKNADILRYARLLILSKNSTSARDLPGIAFELLEKRDWG